MYWNGSNRNGRKVAKSTYLAIVKATDLETGRSYTESFFIGVR